MAWARAMCLRRTSMQPRLAAGSPSLKRKRPAPRWALAPLPLRPLPPRLQEIRGRVRAAFRTPASSAAIAARRSPRRPAPGHAHAACRTPATSAETAAPSDRSAPNGRDPAWIAAVFVLTPPARTTKQKAHNQHGCEPSLYKMRRALCSIREQRPKAKLAIRLPRSVRTPHMKKRRSLERRFRDYIRLMKRPSRVSICSTSPTSTNMGTFTSAPVSSVAGLVEP